MTGQLEIPFALGATVWFTGPKYEETYVQCQDCAGSKVLMVLTGDGGCYQLKCHACGKGYEESAGVVRKTVCGYRPRLVTLRELHHYSGPTSTYVTDAGDTGLVCADRLFATEEECAAECERLRAEHQAEEDRRALAHLNNRRDSMAFSVPYWRAQLRKLRKDVERVEGYLRDLKKEQAK